LNRRFDPGTGPASKWRDSSQDSQTRTGAGGVVTTGCGVDGGRVSSNDERRVVKAHRSQINDVCRGSKLAWSNYGSDSEDSDMTL
jgi:hypothetical protein